MLLNVTYLLIQNTANAVMLVKQSWNGPLIFNPKIFPPDLAIGGMAFIAAWWGIWHIIAGLGIAGFWSRRPAAVTA